MEEHTDYIEFTRPGGKKVRVVFELYRYEILFYYFEYMHNEESDWKSFSQSDDGYYYYMISDESGNPVQERIKFVTFEEIQQAQDEINKRYNILSV